MFINNKICSSDNKSYSSDVPDERIFIHRARLMNKFLLFDAHKFNLMTIYFFDEFCYQKPTILFINLTYESSRIANFGGFEDISYYCVIFISCEGGERERLEMRKRETKSQDNSTRGIR